MKKNAAELIPFENHLPEEIICPLFSVRGKTESHENRFVFSFEEQKNEPKNDLQA